ncbi:MAG: hypothetical protein R3E83_01670 [Burkholderiaceae bacterium]
MAFDERGGRSGFFAAAKPKKCDRMLDHPARPQRGRWLKKEVHCDMIQFTSVAASASLTWGLAGIGIWPQTPEPRHEPWSQFGRRARRHPCLAAAQPEGRADQFLIHRVAGRAILLGQLQVGMGDTGGGQGSRRGRGRQRTR